MRLKFLLLMLSGALLTTACSDDEVQDMDSNTDIKALKLEAVGSIFSSIARQPELAQEIEQTGSNILAYKDISELAPLADKAVAARGRARGLSISMLFTAVARNPDMMPQLAKAAEKWLGTASNPGLTPELNTYASIAASSELFDAMARQPEMASQLDSLSVVFLGTSPSIKSK